MHKSMWRILFWNILHGGGTRRIPEIALALLEQAPDLIVLCEYRTTMGGQLRGVLADHGYEHQACTDPPEGRNGLLIVSKAPIARLPDLTSPTPQRLIAASVYPPGQPPFTLIGAHVPPLEAQDGEAQAVWQALLMAARNLSEVPTLLIGDLNAGRRWQDEAGVIGSRRLSKEDSALQRVGTEAMGRLWLMGYKDLWRDQGAAADATAPAIIRATEQTPPLPADSPQIHPISREFSWFSHEGRGVRIDHALASTSLAPRVLGARYDHRVRAQGLSDHAAMVVDISSSACI